MSQERSANPVALARMELDKLEGQFESALPSHIPVERFSRVVMTAIQNNQDLLKADRRSLWNAAMKSAQDGLLPDGREGAIVAYQGQAQWMPMVGGIRKKVRNSGEIATWDVQAVYANDVFEFELGDEPFIKHRPSLKDRGEIIAVYSIATLKSGEKSRDVMGIGEVEKIRSISRAKNGPWANPIFYPEMAKKTVARRHSKVLPMSSDLDDLIRRDDGLYDLDGASDKAVKGQRKTLTDRLASISADNNDVIDNATGEIVDNGSLGKKLEAVATKDSTKQDADKQSQRASQSNDANDFPGDRPSNQQTQTAKTASQPTGDEIEAAKDRGGEAYHRGQSRKAVPAEYRDSGVLSGAWFEGYDSQKEDDQKDGDA